MCIHFRYDKHKLTITCNSFYFDVGLGPVFIDLYVFILTTSIYHLLCIYTGDFVRYVHNSFENSQKERISQLSSVDINPALDALNSMAATPWVINKPVSIVGWGAGL